VARAGGGGEGVDGVEEKEEESSGVAFSLEEEDMCVWKKEINGPAHTARTGVRRLVGGRPGCSIGVPYITWGVCM
jgi:hypothetical protein